MFRAQDFAGFNIIRGKNDYAGGPKLIEGICEGDWAVVIQPSRVSFLITEDRVALEPGGRRNPIDSHRLEK